VINFINDHPQISPTIIAGGKSADYVYLSSGKVVFKVGSALETIIDATGKGNSVVHASSKDAAVTVIGANGTRATLEVTDFGSFTLSPKTSNTIVKLGQGSSVTMSGNVNVDILVSGQQTNTSTAFRDNPVSAGSITGLTSVSQSVTNGTSSKLFVSASVAGAGALIDGGAGGATVTISSKGSVLQNALSRNLTYVLPNATILTLNSDDKSNVEIPIGAEKGSIIKLGTRGQSVESFNGLEVTVLADSTLLNNSTKFSGGGAGVLHITGGGTVNLGSNITGISKILIGNNSRENSLSIILSDFQSESTIFDVNGGSTITLSEKKQTVVNLGLTPTKVRASSDNVGGKIDGGVGGVVLELVDDREFVLGDQLSNVLVRLGGRMSLETSPTSFLRVDASAGRSTISTFGEQQTIISGRGNKIFDRSGRGMIIEGTIDQLKDNEWRGFNHNDLVRIVGLDAGNLKSSLRMKGDGGTLLLSGQGKAAVINIPGLPLGGYFSVTSDGGSGSFMKYVVA